MPSLLSSSDFVIPSDAPQWLQENLKHDFRSQQVAIDFSHIPSNTQHKVHYLSWNEDKTDLPVLALVHGFCASAYWWAAIAPFFTEHYRVIAIDLPGMGDSDHLPSYEHDDVFAHAIVSLIESLNLTDVTLLGHSFGGAQTLRSVALKPDLFERAIVVDSVVRFAGEDPIPVIRERGPQKPRPSQLLCQQQFHPAPPQPNCIETIVQFIGHHACRPLENGQGWIWKFDPKVRNFGEIRDLTLLQRLTTSVDLIYAEHSLFNDNNRPKRILDCLGNAGQLVMVDDAYHHIMLDRPLALVRAIKLILDLQD